MWKKNMSKSGDYACLLFSYCLRALQDGMVLVGKGMPEYLFKSNPSIYNQSFVIILVRVYNWHSIHRYNRDTIATLSRLQIEYESERNLSFTVLIYSGGMPNFRPALIVLWKRCFLQGWVEAVSWSYLLLEDCSETAIMQAGTIAILNYKDHNLQNVTNGLIIDTKSNIENQMPSYKTRLQQRQQISSGKEQSHSMTWVALLGKRIESISTLLLWRWARCAMMSWLIIKWKEIW